LGHNRKASIVDSFLTQIVEGDRLSPQRVISISLLVGFTKEANAIAHHFRLNIPAK
jgi:hypothetical protein